MLVRKVVGGLVLKVLRVPVPEIRAVLTAAFV